MKKYYSFILIVTVIMLAATSITSAEQDDRGGDRPLPRPGNIGQQLRNNYQDKLENVRKNEGDRNGMLENRFGSSTRPQRMEARDELKDRCEEFLKNHASSTNLASSTLDKPCREAREIKKEDREERKDDRREFRIGEFKNRKENIVRQMTNALENLAQIRTRIDSRIKKEQQIGTNMASSTALLVIADQKISLATTAVNALAVYMPNALSTASASTTIDIQTARKLAETAITSVGDARKALNQVVRAIAHAMGLDIEDKN